MQSAGRQSNANNELQQLDTITTTHRSTTSTNENNVIGAANTVSVMDQTKIAGGAMSSLAYTSQ